MSPDKAALYRAGQRRVVDLVRRLDDGQRETIVPGCPEWTVKDLLAHLAGSTSDYVSQNMQGAPGDGWTAAQVTARRGRSTDEVLDEWVGLGADFTALLEQVPPGLSGIAVMDLVTHEHDLREAVGDESPRDQESVAFTLKGFVNSLGGRLDRAGLPGLRVLATDGAERVAGQAEPGATVRGEAYELMRALSGRRTRDEVRSLDWEGDAEPYLEVFSPFGALPG